MQLCGCGQDLWIAYTQPPTVFFNGHAGAASLGYCFVHIVMESRAPLYDDVFSVIRGKLWLHRVLHVHHSWREVVSTRSYMVETL